MLEILLAVASLLVPSDHAELVFAGDAMQHQRQIDAARMPDGSLDYSPYFEALKPYIESADYAVVNLETPLGGEPYSGYPMFCAHGTSLRSKVLMVLNTPLSLRSSMWLLADSIRSNPASVSVDR